METKIDLYLCDNCDTAMSIKAIGYCDDEQTLCDNCFNGAIAKAELAWDAANGR